MATYRSDRARFHDDLRLFREPPSPGKSRYGVDAREARSTDEVTTLVEAAVADRDRPTLINARITPVAA